MGSKGRGERPGTPGRASAGRTTRTLRVGVLIAGAVLVAVTGILFAVDPAVGEPFCRYALLACMTVVVVGPLLRRAEPWWVWLPETAGASAFWVVLALDTMPFEWTEQLVALSNALYTAGYMCLMIWLALLGRIAGTRDRAGRLGVLDVAAVSVGVALLFWVITVTGFRGDSPTPGVFAWVTYIVLDVVLLGLMMHVAARLGVWLVPLRWFAAGVATLVVGDTILALFAVSDRSDGPLQGFVPCLFLAAYFCLAAAASHPDITRLVAGATGAPQVRRNRPPSALMLVSVFPPVLAVALPVPESGSMVHLDVAVRTVLTVALVGILFRRLTTTISALSDAEEAQYRRATQDPLTGLLNRGALIDELRSVLDAPPGSAGVAVFFLDCDNFKFVNDTWGHAAGDQLLLDIAARLRACFGETDLVARQGGDEFVLVTRVTSEDEAREKAELLRGCFEEPLRILHDRRHQMTPSIGGIVLCPGSTLTTDEVLNRADLAMYEAKRLGRGSTVLFDDALEARLQTQQQLGDRLARAVEDDLIDIALQPILAGPPYTDIQGWEALARWNDPVLGRVSPEVFIPVAEQLGLIRPLGQRVLEKASVALMRLDAAYPDLELGVSVNMSVGQLFDRSFVAMVQRVLDATGLEPDRLMLEVTESMLVEEGAVAVESLEALHRMGVRIAVDDYGTGYSSLPTLTRFPIDFVKLDRSFTDRLVTDSQGPRQMRAVLDLIRSLGTCSIIAEGIETPHQEQIVTELGCPLVQGWLYGEPEPVEAWIAYEGRWPWSERRSLRPTGVPDDWEDGVASA